jgi:hypothetical protein
MARQFDIKDVEELGPNYLQILAAVGDLAVGQHVSVQVTRK